MQAQRFDGAKEEQGARVRSKAFTRDNMGRVASLALRVSLLMILFFETHFRKEKKPKKVGIRQRIVFENLSFPKGRRAEGWGGTAPEAPEGPGMSEPQQLLPATSTSLEEFGGQETARWPTS